MSSAFYDEQEDSRLSKKSDSQSEVSESLPPIEIKPEFVSKDILNSIIQEFVLREGTNYGDVEFSLETKIKQVEKQILRGDVKVVFDPNTESVTLMTSREFFK